MFKQGKKILLRRVLRGCGDAADVAIKGEDALWMAGALRPVEAMRTRAAAISAEDLGHCLSAPVETSSGGWAKP